MPKKNAEENLENNIDTQNPEPIEAEVNAEIPETEVSAEPELDVAEPVADNTTEAEEVSQNEEAKTYDFAANSTEEPTVTVQPVKFASFENINSTQGETNKNLDLLMDIKLQLTVELGRTELPIKKVLELTRGSIIELEKVAGEPVELYANGKLVAHGEVVVIEDNFGLRITSITDPDERLRGIQ